MKKAILSLLVVAIITYVILGYLASFSVSPTYMSVFNLVENRSESLNEIHVVNDRLIDLSDINIKMNLDCQKFYVYEPQITAGPLTKGCEITYPTTGAGSNLLNIYCDRINTMGVLLLNGITRMNQILIVL